MGEPAQLSFAPKISGEFLSIWAKFPQFSKFFSWAMDEIHPNWEKFARNFWGRTSTARIRPFRTSLAQKKITVYVASEKALPFKYQGKFSWPEKGFIVFLGVGLPKKGVIRSILRWHFLNKTSNLNFDSGSYGKISILLRSVQQISP
jgi:hypothetical protein